MVLVGEHLGIPYFAMCNAHPHFCAHYTRDRYTHGMYTWYYTHV